MQGLEAGRILRFSEVQHELCPPLQLTQQVEIVIRRTPCTSLFHVCDQLTTAPQRTIKNPQKAPGRATVDPPLFCRGMLDLLRTNVP